MVCKRCGKKFNKKGATEKMILQSLCILCIMEYTRKYQTKMTLEEFAETKRESHFKM